MDDLINNNKNLDKIKLLNELKLSVELIKETAYHIEQALLLYKEVGDYEEVKADDE